MTPAGNTTFRFRDVTMSGLAHVLAPQVVPSARFEELLEPARQRLRLPANLLERVSGVRERRWWDEDDDFQVRTAEAGSKALAEAGVEPADVGLMINTSVSRPHLEPSVAVAVHDEMGLPSSALNFDITSACVGFVKGIVVAASMIEALVSSGAPESQASSNRFGVAMEARESRRSRMAIAVSCGT